MSIYHIIMLCINLFEPSKLKRLKGLDENRKSQCVFLGNNIKKNEKCTFLLNQLKFLATHKNGKIFF